MIKNIYSIKDVKLGFEPPFCRENDELAKRDFFSAAKYGSVENNRFKQSPADFELYKIGTFNMENGSIETDVQYIANLVGVLEV